MKKLMFAAALAAAVVASAGEFKAGFARVDITPPLGSYMPGYYQVRRAKSILDPLQIKITEFWKVKGDPLARALRKYFKSRQTFPAKKFQCVFSDEQRKNALQPTDQTRANGTAMHITAIFGLMLSSLVIKDACK